LTLERGKSAKIGRNVLPWAGLVPIPDRSSVRDLLERLDHIEAALQQHRRSDEAGATAGVDGVPRAGC
jgi:hypothetical protein